MNKKTQSGFAHLIVITAILGLAVIGLLGFVFYQNFIQKKDTINKTDDSSKVADADTNVEIVPLNKSISESVTGENLTLNYPSNWITNVDVPSLNPSQETSSMKIVITSPDTKVNVSLWAGLDGIGGTCADSENYVITSLKTYTLAKYSGYTLYEYVTTYPSDGYSISSSVIADNSTIKVGESACNIGLSIFKASNGTSNQLLIGFNDDLVSTNSMDEINSARATDNYQTAVKIVRSLHQK